MRTIHVPKPSSAWHVLVHGHQDGWQALSDLLRPPTRTAQERHYAQLVKALTRAVGLEHNSAEDGGWATVWTSNSIEGTDLGEQHWRTWISVDDDQGGERMFGALLRALDEQDIPFDSAACREMLPPESHPVHARWGTWCFGPQRGSIKASLQPEHGVVGVEVVREAPLPSLKCLACEATASPIPRILGYPSPEGELGVLLGELVYGTCVVGGPMATAECGACGKGLVPGSADEEEVVGSVTGGFAHQARVERFRRLIVGGRAGTLVWTPYATQRNGWWMFSLSAAVRQRLSAASNAVVALRPRGLPALFVPWAHIEPMTVDDERERMALRVSKREPTTVKLGKATVDAVTHPERLTPPPPAPTAHRHGASARPTRPDTEVCAWESG